MALSKVGQRKQCRLSALPTKIWSKVTQCRMKTLCQRRKKCKYLIIEDRLWTIQALCEPLWELKSRNRLIILWSKVRQRCNHRQQRASMTSKMRHFTTWSSCKWTTSSKDINYNFSKDRKDRRASLQAIRAQIGEPRELASQETMATRQSKGDLREVLSLDQWQPCCYHRRILSKSRPSKTSRVSLQAREALQSSKQGMSQQISQRNQLARLELNQLQAEHLNRDSVTKARC